jgi:WS/DGAT/MGAT family acyltransferase
MERLAGIDAAFLYLETPSAHMHVVVTFILDPAAPGSVCDTAAIGRTIAERLARVRRFRQRVVAVPLGLDHPRLADDPAFEAEHHVRCLNLPEPGSEDDLERAVALIASRPLARDRALWELWQIGGLAGGGVAVVLKVHHAVIDGVSGSDLMARLFDLAPGAEPPAPEESAWLRRPLPSPLALVPPALLSAATWPLSFVRALGDSLRSAVRVVDRAVASASALPGPTMPFDAPRTVFNGAISGERAVAFTRIPLADIKTLRRRLDATVNDVVLTLCTMSLRQFLAGHGGIPDRPLVASVPVAVPVGEPHAFNHVSAMLVGLPVHLDDPRAQLRFIAEHAERAKGLHRAAGGDLLRAWAELAPPGLLTGVARLISRWRLADRFQPVHNLVVSNVPGPQMPLYAAGARVVGVYPLGPVLEGAGMNLTVISYDGTVFVGVVTCRQAVPDAAPIAAGCVAAARRLAAITGVEAARGVHRVPPGTDAPS